MKYIAHRDKPSLWPCLKGGLVAAVLAAFCCAASAQPSLVSILVEDDAEPFSRQDGSGYANEIVQAAFAAVGVKAELKVVPYARCKALVLAGSEAACFSMSWDASFQGVLQFSRKPLFSVTPIYFQNRKHRLAAKTESDLGGGLTIGIVNGYEYPESAMRAQTRGAAFAAARTEQVNLKKLALGRIDAALVMDNALHGASQWVRDAGVEKDVMATFASTRQDAYIGFSLQHPQGAWALAQFDKGYAAITETGVARKIADKWARSQAPLKAP
jgi:ABC-type amino acid transport substrate-binding protein